MPIYAFVRPSIMRVFWISRRSTISSKPGTATPWRTFSHGGRSGLARRPSRAPLTDALPRRQIGCVRAKAARVQLVEHPVHGLVASSVEIVSGALDVADLSWSLDGRHESLDATLNGGSVEAASAPIPIAEVAPLQPPFLVSLLLVEGPLALAGTAQPPGLPTSPHAVWVGASLLISGWFAARRLH